MTGTTVVYFQRAGMNLGWKAGLVLSSVYAIIGFLVIELLGYGVGLFSLEFYESIRWREFFVVIIMAITILAIAPAMVIGAVTGMCLGVLTEITRGRISKYPFILLCIVSCLVVVVLLHLLFQIPITLSFQVSSTDSYSLGIYETYPFYIGIPSVIYILAGGWIGWQLYSVDALE